MTARLAMHGEHVQPNRWRFAALSCCQEALNGTGKAGHTPRPAVKGLLYDFHAC